MSGPLSGTVLVTGGSGVLGVALLREVADLDVVALRHRGPLPPGTRRTLAGSVVEPRLGLTRSDYALLARDVSCVIHSAAVTDWGAGRAQLTDVNVGGTARALSFAQAAGALFVHVSTALPLEHGEPPNGRPDDGRRRPVPLERYLRSKREADELVAASGHRALIARPTWVAGDAATGETSSFQGLHSLVRHILEGDIPIFPAPPPPIDPKLDFLPRDAMARALRFAIEDGFDDGDLWLAAGPEALPAEAGLDVLRDFAAAVGVEFAPPPIVPLETMERLIRPAILPALPRRVQRRFEYLWQLAQPLFADYRCQSSLAALRARGLRLDLDLRASFASSLRYWARTTGWGDRASA